jgi:hypothetical protein
MSAELEAASNPLDGRITEIFSVPLTSYIDGVERGVGNPETRRPRLSDYHLNQYERFAHPHGAAIADPQGADEEQDVSNTGVTHTTIDDNPAVLNLLKQRIKQKVVH